MLNLRVTSCRSNLACLFSLRSKIHAQSSSHFASLEPRTFFVSVYFASLMQRKYLAEFLELKKKSAVDFLNHIV